MSAARSGRRAATGTVRKEGSEVEGGSEEGWWWG